MMPRPITIGIAGHVDHGKTSLVKSLTGIDTDRSMEEKRRGLSMEFGIAPLLLSPGLEVSLVDVPGHTDFMKNTIRGLSAVDAAILVVAADDGVMPQTREHLEILKYLEVASGLIVLSKVDLVDQDTLDLAELEVRDLTGGSFLEDAPVITFSAVSGKGRDEILAAMKTMGTSVCSVKETNKPFRMFIDQIRTLQGYGTVVSGTVLSGVVHQGDTVEIIPAGRTARVRSLQSHHAGIDSAFAGFRVGLNLQGISINDISRGMVLAEPGSVQPVRFLNGVLSVTGFSRKPVCMGERVRVYLGTAVTSARIVLMEESKLGPGAMGFAQMRMADSIGVLPDDRYVITPLNSPMILGGGRVLETTPVKFRNAHAGRIIPVLNALKKRDPHALITAFACARPERAIYSDELCRITGASLDLIEKALKGCVSSGLLMQMGERGHFSSEFFRRMKGQVVANVEEMLSRDRDKNYVGSANISSSLPHELDTRFMEFVLNDLIREGKLLAISGGFTTKTLSQGRTSEGDRMSRCILSTIEVSGTVPVTTSAILEKLQQERETRGIRRSLDYLLSRGDIVRLSNERYLSKQGLLVIKDRVCRWIEVNGSIKASDCPDVLGYGRSAGVPVLEYLDSVGFTERKGNERVLKDKGDASAYP